MIDAIVYNAHINVYFWQFMDIFIQLQNLLYVCVVLVSRHNVCSQ